jgi:hypothetical protein
MAGTYPCILGSAFWRTNDYAAAVPEHALTTTAVIHVLVLVSCLQVRADLEMAGKLLAKRAQQQLKHNDSGKSEASIFMPPPPSAEDMGGATQLQPWQAAMVATCLQDKSLAVTPDSYRLVDVATLLSNLLDA